MAGGRRHVGITSGASLRVAAERVVDYFRERGAAQVESRIVNENASLSLPLELRRAVG
jgi:hypothetical protein